MRAYTWEVSLELHDPQPCCWVIVGTRLFSKIREKIYERRFTNLHEGCSPSVARCHG